MLWSCQSSVVSLFLMESFFKALFIILNKYHCFWAEFFQLQHHHLSGKKNEIACLMSHYHYIVQEMKKIEIGQIWKWVVSAQQFQHARDVDFIDSFLIVISSDHFFCRLISDTWGYQSLLQQWRTVYAEYEWHSDICTYIQVQHMEIQSFLFINVFYFLAK